MKNKDRQLIYKKYNGKCAYCGCELEKGWHVDHIEPVVRDLNNPSKLLFPERDNISNCNPSCSSCNINKHSMSIELFRIVIKNYVTSLYKYSTQYRMAKKYGLIKEVDTEVKFYFEQYEK